MRGYCEGSEYEQYVRVQKCLISLKNMYNMLMRNHRMWTPLWVIINLRKFAEMLLRTWPLWGFEHIFSCSCASHKLNYYVVLTQCGAGDITLTLMLVWGDFSLFPLYNRLLSVIRMCLMWVHPICAPAISSVALCITSYWLLIKSRVCMWNGRGRTEDTACLWSSEMFIR